MLSQLRFLSVLHICNIWSNIHLAHRAWLIFCMLLITDKTIGLLLWRCALGVALYSIMDILHVVHSRPGFYENSM